MREISVRGALPRARRRAAARPLHAALLGLGLVAVGERVRADEVHLHGGATIEGRASHHGDQVVVKVESGEIRLPADAVARIDSAVSHHELLEQRRAALRPDDVRGRLALASFCREHELLASERALLLEVIALEPDQPEARRRLGHVKGPHGWIDRAEQLRAAREAELAAWLEQKRADERELARLALEREQAQAAQRRAELEAERAREAYEAARSAQLSAAPVWVQPWPQRELHRRHFQRGHAGRSQRQDSAGPAPQRFPINGVRDPRDTSFFLPGVKDPRESLR
jgi:hypothetical protein